MKQILMKACKKIGVPVLSTIAALLAGILIIELTGNHAAEAYSYMLRGAFGSTNSICELLVISIPLILTGLAVTFAYRSGVFTIGVDGQLIMGAIAAAWFVRQFSSLPRAVLIPGCLMTGMAVGALWGALAGALKAYRGVNEIVSTLLLNYVALYLVDYLYTYPLADSSSNIPQTEQVAENARLGTLVGGTRLHTGLLLALICVLLVSYLLFRTDWGTRFRAVGLNQTAALINGISVKRYMVISMAISGAIGGLAGTIELLGTQFRVQSGFCADYGFDGIAVALIGQLHPVGVVLSALFFGALNVGSNSMELMTNVPSSIADIIQAIIIFFVVAGSVLVNRGAIRRLFQRNRGKEQTR